MYNIHNIDKTLFECFTSHENVDLRDNVSFKATTLSRMYDIKKYLPTFTW